MSNISSDMYTDEDKKEFGIDWTLVLCKAGDARIT